MEANIIKISNNEFMTEKEVAEFLKVRPNTLAAWRYENRELPFYKFGRRVRYRKDDVLAFAGKCCVN